MSVVEFRKKLFEFIDLYNLVLINSSKNRFLLLKSSTIEHTLAKRVSCEIYTP